MKKIYGLILVFCVFLFSYQLNAGKKFKSHRPYYNEHHQHRQRREIYKSLQEQIADLATMLKLTRLLNQQPGPLVTLAPSVRRIIIDFSKQ